MEEPPKEESICISCGLCCDGTVYEHGAPYPDDDIKPLQALGVIVGEDHRFHMPCPAHCGVCTIFQQSPQACRDFECKLLARLSRGEVTRQDALAVIEKIKALRDKIRAGIQTAGVDPMKMPINHAFAEVASLDMELQMDHEILQMELRRHFRGKP